MRFNDYITEDTIDVVDTGKKGKQFENKFIKALKMVGLDFDTNTKTGAMWDIKPKGSGWKRIVSEKPVNIKVAGTKWMFGTSELVNKLPWDQLPEDFNSDKAAMSVKRFFNKKGLADVVYLKPIGKEIQDAIITAVDEEDIEKLDTLMNRKNFYAEKLGRGYRVRILTNGERVTSVAIDKNNKVFMRSEKPRKLGGTQMVTFRTPTTKLGKAVQKQIKEGVEEDFLREIIDILETSGSLALAKLDIIALSHEYAEQGKLSLTQQVKIVDMINKLKGILK